MFDKTEKDNRGMHNNNVIYRLVGALIYYKGKLEADPSAANLSENELKAALKEKVADSRFQKDLRSLGGVDSATFNELLDVFVDALPKKVTQEAMPIHAYPAAFLSSLLGQPTVTHRTIYHYETVDVHCHRCRRSCCNCSPAGDSFWFWMYLFNLGGSRTTVVHTNQKKESAADVIFGLVVFLTVIMTIASAVIAAIYLFGQVADIIERIRHNEGVSYALLSFTLLTAAAAGSFFGATLSVPLILLAASAGNPVGWSIFGIICLGMVFTSLAHAFLLNVPAFASEKNFQDNFGSNSFVTKDYGRVQLTEMEEKNLCENEGLDPIKVRLAIALLRHEMGAGGVPNKYGNHALFNQSCRTKEQQKCLDIIRVLRTGHLDDQAFSHGEIKIGNMTVNMCLTSKKTKENESGNGAQKDSGNNGQQPELQDERDKHGLFKPDPPVVVPDESDRLYEVPPI
ncbi:MAG: hypothetical protein P1U32_00825 [Legionellaceae bacterium]|nr:hypothetical protein [Legionellaceae bacterium]